MRRDSSPRTLLPSPVAESAANRTTGDGAIYEGVNDLAHVNGMRKIAQNPDPKWTTREARGNSRVTPLPGGPAVYRYTSRFEDPRPCGLASNLPAAL
jgi:hypothetical protein